MGRVDELRALDDTLTGGARSVLLSGDAGIGKSRLLAEALRRARARGAVTLTAGCLPLTEKLPLLPVTDALRQLAGDTGGRRLAAALNDLPHYVRGELARLLPAFGPSTPAHSGPAQAWERDRLFAAVADLLAEVSRRAPVVLAFEDIQWADDLTLDLLTYLRVAARDCLLSLVVTVRTDGAPLRDTVADWLTHARTSATLDLRLGALSCDDVARQTAGLIGDSPADDLVAELYARAAGNPFLTEQLVMAALTTTHGRCDRTIALPRHLPRRLAELLVARVRLVGDDARAVLSMMAVAGRPLTEPVLVELTAIPLVDLRRALRELAAAALLATADEVPLDEPDSYRPRHALLAEAVRNHLLPGERAALHARTAEVLESVGGPGLAAEVAAHWARAGRPADELRASVVAARAAEELFAFGEAALLHQRAITLAQNHPAAAAALGLDLALLHVRAVDVLEAAGRRTEARSLAEETYRRFSDWPDRQVAALVHLRAGAIRRYADPAGARPLFEAAVRLFAGTVPTAEYAEALRMQAIMFRFEGRSELAVTGLEEALQVAEAAGAVEPQVRVLANLAAVSFLRGKVDDGMAALRQGRRLADGLANAEPGIWIAAGESDALIRLGRLAEARQAALEGYERARQGGQAGRFHAGILLYNAADALLESGDTAAAADLLEPVTDGEPHGDGWMLQIQRAEVDLRRGLLDQAAERLAGVRAVLTDGHLDLARDTAYRTADVALWRRRPEQALAAVEEVLADAEGTDLEFLLGEFFVLGARAVADLTQRARARGDRTAARGADDAAARLAAALDRMRRRPLEQHPLMVRNEADRAMWTAESDRAADGRDVEVWEAAAHRWEVLGRPHRCGYALWRGAEVALQVSDRTRAAALLSAAATQAEGMKPLTAAVRRLAERARVRLGPGTGDPEPAAGPCGQSAHPMPAASGCQLTPRERLVLRLVALGRTNRQIGAELYMSPKTASVHVTNILRKFGAANRTEAATLAERAGLLAGAEDAASPSHSDRNR
ncbi:LuxR family transcriptional regulator [Plantactinospora veratri]